MDFWAIKGPQTCQLLMDIRDINDSKDIKDIISEISRDIRDIKHIKEYQGSQRFEGLSGTPMISCISRKYGISKNIKGYQECR